MRGYITDPAARAGLRLTADLPEPAPAPDEFVLDVRAYAINPGEAHLIAARPDGWRPGQDVAGVVLCAAANGTGPPAGTRVTAVVDWEGWAERIPVPVPWAALIDDRLSFEQAASLPCAGLTALRALREGGAVLGRNVLITGATGGVGQFAVQLAVASGAHVTAHVRASARAVEARELGAHQVVTSLEDERLGPFHLVLDGVGGPLLTQAVHRMAPGATAVAYSSVAGATEIRVRDFVSPAYDGRSAYNGRIIGFVSTVPEATKGEDIAILAGLVADGRLTPRIGWTADWERTPDAFEALAERKFRGKAVLTVPSS